MKIIFVVDYADGVHKDRPMATEWQEDIFVDGMVDDHSAELAVREVISSFNSTLRPGEKPRNLVRLVGILPLDKCPVSPTRF